MKVNVRTEAQCSQSVNYFDRYVVVLNAANVLLACSAHEGRPWAQSASRCRTHTKGLEAQHRLNYWIHSLVRQHSDRVFGLAFAYES